MLGLIIMPYICRWLFSTLYFANFADWDHFRENCNIEYVFFAHVITSIVCTYVHTPGCMGRLISPKYFSWNQFPWISRNIIALKITTYTVHTFCVSQLGSQLWLIYLDKLPFLVASIIYIITIITNSQLTI